MALGILAGAAGLVKRLTGGGRYENIVRLVEENRCRRIMEIGTWNGEHARMMIKAAQRHFPAQEVEYYGFDLFEMMDAEKLKEELAKIPPSLKEVKAKLEGTGAKITLFIGDTKDTLPKHVGSLPKMDMIFIDGGHSLRTIRNDWEHSRKLMGERTVVVFDDYFRNSEPELRGIGCQDLINGLDMGRYNIELLNPEEHFKKSWGTIHTSMVKVQMRTGVK